MSGALFRSLMTVTLPLRQGVRAVVLDVDDRILLVKFRFPDRSFWSTPGGGIELGETLEIAIRRELREEVGLAEVDLGPVIWQRTHEFEADEYSGQYEIFFLVRTSASLVEPSFSEQELMAENLVGSRWWSVREIREATDEGFSPARLASLLEELLEDGPSEVIIDTGV